MIFNLNEQKVLSDPSGSSVFKGEKDFNDIVVNLPDEIDGHTATELNYVMHFVDSDGGYSTKILTVDSSGEALKATATVSTSITSKAQAFYAYVLMTDDEETVIGKTNGVIVMIHPVPDEENEIIPPADADKIIKGLEEIVKEATETIEAATDTIEEATEAISSKQDKLTAGENITISDDNIISAEGGGVTSYRQLSDLPELLYTTAESYDQRRLPFRTFLSFSTGLYCSLGDGGIELNVRTENFFWCEDYEFGRNIDSLGPLKGQSFSLAVISSRLRNCPEIVTNSITSNEKVIFWQIGNGKIEKTAQFIAWKDTDGNSRLIYRQADNLDSTLSGAWIELTGGGSQIVSGVVNSNGTITFTDSDGNTFTTTGSSVIGADGFSPVATVTQTASGATVSITDSTGTTTANISNGQDGNDYVLTAQDKSDIADIVLSELPTTQGVLYGNTSN